MPKLIDVTMLNDVAAITLLNIEFSAKGLEERFPELEIVACVPNCEGTSGAIESRTKLHDIVTVYDFNGAVSFHFIGPKGSFQGPIPTR